MLEASIQLGYNTVSGGTVSMVARVTYHVTQHRQPRLLIRKRIPQPQLDSRSTTEYITFQLSIQVCPFSFFFSSYFSLLTS